MKKSILFVLLVIVTNSFGQITNAKKRIVYVQPLGDVNKEYIEFAKKSIESYYGFTCVIRPKAELTNDILAKSKTRYEALKILKKFNSKDHVVLITEKDIAMAKGKVPEWGIMGLGFQPGNVCVISTFRIKRGVSDKTFYTRFEKVVLHEVGHNLGLEHCDNHPQCMMNDKKGSVKQVDKEKLWLCDKCKKIIGYK